MFKNMSLRNKILIPIAFTVFIAFSFMIGLFVSYAGKNLEQTFMKLAEETASRYGNEIKSEIESAFDSARTVAHIFEGMKQAGNIPERDVLNQILKNILVENPKLTGIWTCWEPDALDGRDKEFIHKTESGNDSSGRYMPCWNRFSGKIKLQSLENIKNHDFITYYIKAKKIEKEMLTEPLIHEAALEKDFHINLIVPVKHKGRFIGAVGVSISLDFCRIQVARVRPFDTGYGGIVSNTGMITAHSIHDITGHDIFSYIEERHRKTLIQAVEKGETASFFSLFLLDSHIPSCFVFTPFNIGYTGTPWSFFISVPEEKIFENSDNITLWAGGIGLIFILILMLIIFSLSRHIVNPLYKLVWVSKALAEGDFDKRAVIDSKDEFGITSGYINKAFDAVTNKMFWYESILDAIPFPVSVTDMEMKWTFINKKAEDTLGVNRSDITGRHCSYWDKDICNTVDCGIVLLRQVKDSSTFTRRETGQTFKVETAWLRDKQGKKCGHVEVVRDITEAAKLRKKAEDRNWLQTGEADLNHVMHGELDMTLLSKNIITFICKYLNAYAGTFYLMEEKDILKLRAAYAYKERKDLSNEFKIGEGIVGQAGLEKDTILLTRVPDDYIQVTSALGSDVPHNIIVVPFIFQDNTEGVIEVGTFHKISELEKEFLEKAVKHIGVVVNTTRSRRRMEKLLVKTKTQTEELQVQQEELRQYNEELEVQTQSLKDSEANLQAQQEELRVINEELHEKTRDLEKQRDDVHKKNEALETAQKEIEQKAKALETASKYKSEFMANMSHELRTPLNSILILSQLLSNNKESNLSEKQIEFADTIYSSGADLLSLINEILDLSKVEAGKLDIVVEEMYLKELAEDVRRTFGQMAEQKELSLDVELGENLPSFIYTDIKRVWQVMKNLLSNAFKFTEKGGIRLDIYRPGPETAFSSPVMKVENTIAFAVSDTGIGIHESKQSMIFEAFQQADGTTSRKYGGTGLGLSISREFAGALGGEIQLKSEPGKGSRFIFFLPESISSVNKSKKSESPSPSQPPDAKDRKVKLPAHEVYDENMELLKDDRRKIKEGDKSLLIIEDDPNFCRILLDFAHEKGFKVLIAEDGETGLHFADFFKPSGIILDIGLPGIDGWTVMERLKEDSETRHIPVHFISVTDRPLDALRMGAVGFLTKPVSVEMLDDVFKKIDSIVSRPVKKLLVVEDDEVQKLSIMELIGNGDVNTTAVETGGEAYELLEHEMFDCIILDLGLEDMSGFDLLAKIRKSRHMSLIPVIIYTGRDITREEEAELQKYADSIIIKGARSPERLLDETTLFLHRVKSNLPKEKQEMLSARHDTDAVLKDKKILIVDDDMRNVFALASVLEEKGVNLIEGRNGKEALEKLDKNTDTDLVIMDIMMPEMDGYEAIRKIREQKRFKKLPIIALTAKAMKGDKIKCVEAGANDYLAKPVETNKLLSLLRVWLY